MSFYLKKFISLFIKPLNICFILLGIGLYFLIKKEPDYKKAKIFLIAGTAWLFLISWEPLTDWYIAPFERVYETHLRQDSSKDFKYIAVLSSGHADDDRLPATEQHGTQALFRLIEGIRLQRLYPKAKLIFTGYSYNKQRPTGEVSKEAAISLGVDPKKIIAINGTRDTMEESAKIKALVGEEEILLVTSASHMLRSMALFKGQGINATAAPARFKQKGGPILFKTPDSDGIHNTERAIHESAGYIWGWLRGKY